MSKLMTLLAEAKTNLHDLEDLLQKARTLDPDKIADPLLTREEFQGYFDEILRIVEKIPENLKLEDSLLWKTEITRLHCDMEEAKNKVEYSIGQLESMCERNIKQLSEFIETLESREQAKPLEAVADHPVDTLPHLMSQGREYLKNGEHESCMKLMEAILILSPNHEEANSCLKEAQRRWEDRRLEEELAIHIGNLKREAMDLFDQEKFQECVGIFKFLCELDPTNLSMQDYLQLSRLKLEETQGKSSELHEQVVENKSSAFAITIQNPPSKPSNDFRGIASIEKSEETGHYPDLHRPAQDETSGKTVTFGIPETSPPSQAEMISDEPLLEPQLEPSTPETENSLALVPGKLHSEPILNDPKRQRRWLALASAACVIFGALIGAAIFQFTRSSVSTLEVQSDPEGAKVFVDGQFKGLTPFQADSFQAGNYTIRLERDGYLPEAQTFQIVGGVPAKWSVILRVSEMRSMSPVDLQNTAQELFEREQFLEASNQCDLILRKEPQNQSVLLLKKKIIDHYWQEFKSAQQIKYWDNAKLALLNLLKVSPQNADAIKELKNFEWKPKKKKEVVPPIPPDQRKVKVDELHRQLAAALSAGNYFTTASGNAADLIQQLAALSPNDEMAKSGKETVQREGLNQIQKKIQSKDYEAARSLARQLQSYFPGNAELTRVQETLREDESRQSQLRSELIQKAEAALTRGNYVTPASESALAYCNRLLAMDQQNPRAQALRRDSLQKAAEQAKEFVQKERFDEAREVLGALYAVAHNDGKTAVAQELKSLLGRVEFTAVAVIHDHTVGSCSGRLRMNAFVIAYLPSGDSKDGFSQKISEIVGIESGDKLKIQLKNKTYRFEMNASKNKEESRQKLKEVSDQLNHYMEQASQNNRAMSVALRINE